MVVEHKPYYLQNSLGRRRLVTPKPTHYWKCTNCGAFCGFTMCNRAGVIRHNAFCINPNCDKHTDQECVPIEG